MTAQFDDALQQILNLVQDGRIHDKRQLWHDRAKRRLDISYMTLDMALDLLRRAGVIRRVDVTTVQITDYGSQLLGGIVVTREYLESLTVTTPVPQHRPKANESTGTHNQKTERQRNHGQAAWIALFVEILRTEGKPLHFTKILELTLKRSELKQLPDVQNVSTNTVFQILSNNSTFRSLGKVVHPR